MSRKKPSIVATEKISLWRVLVISLGLPILLNAALFLLCFVGRGSMLRARRVVYIAPPIRGGIKGKGICNTLPVLSSNTDSLIVNKL